MGDMVFSPLFDDLDSEREVVLEEIAMYDDTPQELVHDLIGEAVFGSHPLGRPVIGTAEVISTVSRRALRDYHRSAVHAGRTSSWPAPGTSTHDRLVELVEQSVARRTARHRRQGRASARCSRSRRSRACASSEKDTEQYHVCLGAPGVSRSDPRRFAASILDAILGGSASSRLFQEIREKRGMAYAVYSFASQYAETGQIGIYVGTREDNLGEALAIAVEQIGEIAAGRLAPRELERAKENLKGRTLLSMESTSTRMHRLGKSLVTDTEILYVDRCSPRSTPSSPSSCASLAAELLAPERLSAAGIGPRRGVGSSSALEGATPSLARAA